MSAVIVDAGEVGRVESPCLGSMLVSSSGRTGQPAVALFYPKRVLLADVDGVELVSFSTSSRILAFNSVSPAAVAADWILVLTDSNELYVLALKFRNDTQADLVIIKHYRFADAAAELRSKNTALEPRNVVLTQKCFIRVDPTSRFVLVHSCRGFLVVLELRPSKQKLFVAAALNQAPREIKSNPAYLNIEKYKVFENPKMFWIGNDTVLDFHCSKPHSSSPSWWVAILSRNIRLEYKLNFFNLSKVKTTKLNRHSSVLVASSPNLIVPMGKFLIYIYDKTHVIYPLPNIEITQAPNERSASSAEDEYVLAKDCLVKILAFNEGLNENFVSYSVVEDTALLLITSQSEYFKVELLYDYDSPDKIDGSISERIRSITNPETQTSHDTLAIKHWKISKMVSNNEIPPRLTSRIDLHCLSIDSFISVDKHSQMIFFKIQNDSIAASKFLKNENTQLLLPITDLKINEKNEISYTSGDQLNSCFKSDKFTLTLKNEQIKYHMNIGNFVVLLIETPGTHLTADEDKPTERLDIFSSCGNCFASYDFEENVTVADMLPLESFKFYIPDDNDFLTSEVRVLQDQLQNSFLVSTSSSDTDDYESNEDFFMRKKTELLFFIINGENQLELKTISEIKYKMQHMQRADDRTVLLWGPNLYVHLALEVYRDGEQVQLKFIKPYEQTLTVGNFSAVKRLNADLLLLVDSFVGIYIAKYSRMTNRISLKQHLVFEWNLISAIDVFSDDMFVVGDILGNVFLVNMKYGDGGIPSCEIFTRFNLNYGPVSSISCYSLPVEEKPPNTIQVCLVGTMDGNIFRISVSQELDLQLEKLLKSQNKQIVRDCKSNIDCIAKNQVTEINSIPKANTTEEQIDCCFQLWNLLADKLVKTSLITDNELKENSGMDPILLFR